MPTLSKTQLKEKLEHIGVLSPMDLPENYLKDLKIHPIFEDENGEEYYDDYVLNLITEICTNSNVFKEKNNLHTQIELLKKENRALAEKINSIVPVTNNNEQNPGMNSFMLEFKKVVEVFMNELREYNNRAMEAEKKLYLLEDNEKRIKQEYCELSCEIKRLNSELALKNKKLDQLEEHNKKLKTIELQLRLIQLKQKKKKFWEFWK